MMAIMNYAINISTNADCIPLMISSLIEFISLHKISKDFKKRGMKYTGTVIIYSYLQAIGVVNDHDLDCFKFE